MPSTSAVTVPPTILDALRTASARTGAGFEYLLRTAIRESGLKPAAEAATSSAAGLFQFVEQTWLATLKEAGPRHGLASYADDITMVGDRYEVADPQLRQEILALRNDPAVAAVMAGEFTHRNAAELTASLGRAPTSGELYIGHFLGAQGAGDLIRAAVNEPEAAAADLFPTAAQSNRSIFYDAGGDKRSVREVYADLVRHHDRNGPMPSAVEPRETITPFAGLVAFFERLFASPEDKPAVARPPDAVENAAATPPALAEAGGAPTALAARMAAEAYSRQAVEQVQAPAPEAAAAPPLRPTITPGSWTNSLFANAARPAGPLVVIPTRPAN